jgi:hypothetical protein
VDANGQPRIARVWGARPLGAGDVIEFGVLGSASHGFVDAIASGGRAALNLIEVTSYRSRMFKGACRLSPAEPGSAWLDECVTALNQVFTAVGMSAGCADLMLSHAGPSRWMVALELSVESVFDQSPKPGAGAPL